MHRREGSLFQRQKCWLWILTNETETEETRDYSLVDYSAANGVKKKNKSTTAERSKNKKNQKRSYRNLDRRVRAACRRACNELISATERGEKIDGMILCAHFTVHVYLFKSTALSVHVQLSRVMRARETKKRIRRNEIKGIFNHAERKEDPTNQCLTFTARSMSGRFGEMVRWWISLPPCERIW